jgi:hypothetical protein
MQVLQKKENDTYVLMTGTWYPWHETDEQL